MRIINLTNSVINWAPTSCNVNPNEISGEFTALRTAVEGHVPPMVNMYGTKFLVVISPEEKAKYPKLFGIVVPAENIVDADTLKPVEGDVPEGYEKISDSEGNEFVYKVPEKCSFDQVQSDWTEQDTNSPSYIKNKPNIPEGDLVGKKELDETLKQYVQFYEVEKDGQKVQVIVLGNNANLVGFGTGEHKDKNFNLAMLSKYNIVDLGTAELPINLNTPKGVRPTVQEAGQTGEEANKIAYLSDLVGVLKSQVDGAGKTVVVVPNDLILMGESNGAELEDKVEVDGPIPLIRVNPWNVVDVGTPKTITNINTPKDQRPTVQEQGQSGKEAHKIAYLDDIEGKFVTVEQYNELVSRIEALESK